MNYLAHIFLSGNDTEIMIGNILEDFVVGNINHPRNQHLPERIKLGVQLHRQIDTMTDCHPDVRACTLLFRPKFGKYAPIITDVLFDHYIIKHWNTFSKESFDNFRPRVYNSLSKYPEIQPIKMQNIIESMKKHDWLKNYAEDWGLVKAFEGLNKKINKPDIDLTNSLVEFKENYDLIGEKFLSFFKELKNHCDNFIAANQVNGK
jgi:acyl carrier protein phosphodiesterase